MFKNLQFKRLLLIFWINILIIHFNLLNNNDKELLEKILFEKTVSQINKIEFIIEKFYKKFIFQINEDIHNNCKNELKKARFVLQILKEQYSKAIFNNLKDINKINYEIINKIEKTIKLKCANIYNKENDDLLNFNKLYNYLVENTKKEQTKILDKNNLLKEIKQLQNNAKKIKSIIIELDVNFNDNLINAIKDNIDLKVLLEKSIPYTLLFSYIILTTKKDDLPEFLHPIKNIIGDIPRKRYKEINPEEKKPNTKEVDIHEDGIFSTPFFKFRHIIQLDIKPIISFSILNFISITNDFKSIIKWISSIKNKKKDNSNNKEEYLEKDISIFSDLENTQISLLNALKNKKLINIIVKSDLNTIKLITNNLKLTHNINIKEFDSLAFMSNNLSDIFKDINSNTIFLIKDFEILFNFKDDRYIKNIIAEISKIKCLTNNKIIILGQINNNHFEDQNNYQKNKNFFKTIYINQAKQEDIAEFISKEIDNRCLLIKDYEKENIVNLLVNNNLLSKGTLIKLFNDSVEKAHKQEEPFNYNIFKENLEVYLNSQYFE